MADGVWCVILGFGRSKQLSLNKYFDPCTPPMRKGRDGGNGGGGGKKEEKTENSGHYVIDRWNATRSCQNRMKNSTS